MGFYRRWWQTTAEESCDIPADYETALENGDDEEAICLLIVAIRKNDARAMVALGTLMMLGQGIEQNLFDGVAWIRQGACLGDRYGMLLLGSALAAGMGCVLDSGEAAYWYGKAARLGMAEAILALDRLVAKYPGQLDRDGRHDHDRDRIVTSSSDSRH